MIAIRLIVILPLFFALLLMHALPLLPPKSRLFGVEVPPEIRYGREGSQLMRLYQFRLLPFTLAALLAIVLWTGRPLLVIVGIATASFAAIALQFRYHAKALEFALPVPSVRQASLSSGDGGFTRRMLWFAPPLAALLAVGLYLHAHWSRIPETFPVHFDLTGRPNGWSHRTVPGVYGVLILGAFLILFLILLYIIMDLGSRHTTRRSVMLAALAAPSYLIGTLCSLVALLPLYKPPFWLMLILVVGFLPIYVILMAHMFAKPSNGPREVTPDRCWHGNFYYNPDDPALFVETRIGFGYTGNFGRPLSWVLAALLFLFPVGLLLLARKLFG